MCNLFESDAVIDTLELIFNYSNIKPCITEKVLGNLIFDKGFDLKRFNTNISINNEFYEYIKDIASNKSLSKYYSYLPEELKIKIYIERMLDIEKAVDYIKNKRLMF